jgi:branched-chain amino acid transport system substrate-binding protein
MNLTRRTALAAGTAALAAPAILHAQTSGPIKIGALATLEGPFALSGQDGMRGVRMAIAEHNSTAGGRPIELITGSSNAQPDVAIRAARKLVEQDGVAILVGPLSGSEGIAMRDYAKTQPRTTFINGSSGAQETTLRDPAPNFFRFNTEGVQWMAGLGEYVLGKGWRTLAMIAEDYSFPYAQTFGFMLGFCRGGGRMVHKAWVPLGQRDYASAIAGLPQNVDALFCCLGGSDAVNFVSQYQQAGLDLPLIAGSITVDQSILQSQGRQRERLIGTPSAGPIADTNPAPAWQAFVAAYRRQFPDGNPSPGLFAYNYYINTRAGLLALDQVQGDVSDGGAKIRNALSALVIDGPAGRVRLDHNRQAIGNIFITEVRADGPRMINQLVRTVEDVNQTLGLPEAEFIRLGAPSRTNPECR